MARSSSVTAPFMDQVAPSRMSSRFQERWNILELCNRCHPRMPTAAGLDLFQRSPSPLSRAQLLVGNMQPSIGPTASPSRFLTLLLCACS